MSPTLDRWGGVLIDALDAIERREATLLSWGVVDAAFARDELQDLLEQVLDDAGADPFASNDLLDDLERMRLIHPAEDLGRERWRSRSAETIRLLARLRQLFPREDEPTGAWAGAPELVADFRYLHRPRTYPLRDLAPTETLDRIDEGHLSGIRREALRALLDDGSRRLELSGFQLRATQQLLADLDRHQSRGVIISAGTGSGKTLAFYLPALSHLGALVQRNEHWTKAIAVYPRKELLRDQLAETFREARRLDGVLRERGGRPLTVGAYFGDTPWNPQHASKRWSRGPSGGRFVPYMDCPQADCRGDLEWTQANLEARTHAITCTRCGRSIGAEEMILTREQMAATPPDILFTTTEMLNQRMADSANGHVFGVGAPKAPQLVLLDEVHTYEGTTGAQVGMLLRRWQHRVASTVQFVGLSATLREAPAFFSQLTGLRPDRVTHVQPQPDEMIREGAEYLLALRSDPASGASVLSTTIQTAMLLTRTLDPRSSRFAGPSEGVFGQRAFVFTDDLDVTNRLFFDLADAEGLDSWGNPVDPPLATLREPATDPSIGRRRAGQSWDLPEDIGHDLRSQLTVGRTSSQDVGVDERADVIVATASLEVGFNDPTVGAIVQHKAPRGAAAFLQRKGRAGRPRLMRPWTVVVLSDYGRDRETYQTYDLLFDPELDPRYLPVKNRYVLRMHAVEAMFDWASVQLDDAPAGSIWRAVAGPVSSAPWDKARRELQAAFLRLMEELLVDDDLQRSLTSYVQQALRIDREVAYEVLWSPPRPVLLGAVPTLTRRIESRWQRATPLQVREEADLYDEFAPLPDYVSPQLFSPLSLPEVRVVVPPQTKTDEASEEAMPIIQALREFAPGRISRRFGVNNIYNRYWLAPGTLTLEPEQTVTIDDAMDHESLGIYRFEESGRIIDMPAARPVSIETVKADRSFRDSSNAFLEWHTQILPDGDPIPIELPNDGRWSAVIPSIDAYLHANRAHVEVRRFAHRSEADLRLRDGTTVSSRISMTREDGTPVAVGAAFPVDGLRVRIDTPDLGWLVGEPADGQARSLLRSFRSAYLLHRMETDAPLREIANRFQIPWLHLMLVSALVSHAETHDTDLESAFAESQGSLFEQLDAILHVLMARTEPDMLERSTDPEGDGDGGDSDLTFLHERLRSLISDPEVIGRLETLAPTLWERPDERWINWAESRFRATVGNAILSAARTLCPEFDPTELLLDLDPGPGPGGKLRPGEAWLIETTLGGAGFIETLHRRISADPRRFVRLIDSALRPSDTEVIDRQLRRLLERVDRDQKLASAVSDYRAARRHDETVSAFEQLRAAMRQAAIVTTHPVMAATTARVLRPGSGAETDAVLRDLVERWIELEERLGVEVDARVYAYLASERDDLDGPLRNVLAAQTGDRRQWRMDTILSLLWTRGWKARARGLESYNPFADHPPAERVLVLRSLENPTPKVDLGSTDWLEDSHDALTNRGDVLLEAGVGDASSLADALMELQTQPVDAGFLHLYPVLASIDQRDDRYAARVELREVLP